MAFESKNLSVLAYANGFTLWHYTTTEGESKVSTEGYFNDAADMLRGGDMIMANTETGTEYPTAGIFLVRTTIRGYVAVENMTKGN